MMKKIFVRAPIHRKTLAIYRLKARKVFSLRKKLRAAYNLELISQLLTFATGL